MWPARTARNRRNGVCNLSRRPQEACSMKRACIAIVDAIRARIYSYERIAAPRGTNTQFIGALHEVIDLVNPGRRGHDLFSTTKPGIKRSVPGGVTTDDHRDAHTDEL